MSLRTRRASFVVLLAALSGCGGTADTASDTASRMVEIEAVEFAFSARESITISAGETITFAVTNAGTLTHEMEVLTDANRRLGTTGRIEPGARSAVTVTFDEPGTYRVICDIDDHRTLGQQAEFTVAESDPTL